MITHKIAARLLKILSLLAVLLLLAACGESGPTAEDKQKGEAASVTGAPEAAPPAAAPEAQAAATQPAGTAPREHIVYAQATSFDPRVLFINPGDTVKWTNMSPIHDSVSMEGLIPEGAEPWQFAIGENGSVTLDVEGVYIYKCTPHYAVGMVAAIVVGEPANLEQVKVNATGRSKGAVIKVERALAQR